MTGLTWFFILGVVYTVAVICLSARLIWGDDFSEGTLMWEMQMFLRKTDIRFWKFIFFMLLTALLALLWLLPYMR